MYVCDKCLTKHKLKWRRWTTANGSCEVCGEWTLLTWTSDLDRRIGISLEQRALDLKRQLKKHNSIKDHTDCNTCVLDKELCRDFHVPDGVENAGEFCCLINKLCNKCTRKGCGHYQGDI